MVLLQTALVGVVLPLDQMLAISFILLTQPFVFGDGACQTLL